MMLRPLIRPLVRPLVRGVTAPSFGWSPRVLFAAGEQGILWPSITDLYNGGGLYQDSAASALASVGDPVGFVADASGRGNHASQPTATARPTLQQDANGKYYLQFDGVDDFLVTSAIDFTGTDKMTVVAGVRKLSDAAEAVVMEFGETGVPLVTNRISLYAPRTAAAKFGLQSGGSVVANAISDATYSAPITAILTGIGDNANDICQLRINGSLAATSGATDQGTPGYANKSIFIGARAYGSPSRFNGNLYSLLVRGAASTDAQIAAAERYAAVKTGVTLA